MSLPDAARRAARHVAARRRRRRARLGCRRARRGARRAAGAQRADRHQGHRSTPARRRGPRAAWPACSTRPTRSRTTCATRSPPAPGCATRRPCATLVAEAPKAIRYLMRLGAAFDPGARRRRSGARPARAATATTASSTPAATAAAPRCSARSTSRRIGAGVEVLDRAFALDLVIGTGRRRARARRPACASP